MRRHVLFAAVPACVLLLFPLAARAELAPPGDATATALQVGEIVGVSTTGAHAAPDTATAQASVLEVGGEPALGLGGAQSGEGHSDGALLKTGVNDLAHVQVAPWEASASGTAGQDRSSKASAAAARAQVPKVADVDVLESESQASHRAERSTGAGYSNGVDLGLLDALRIVLFHSEVNSEGKGSSYLAGINDLKVGTDEQLGEICALHASPLLTLACLTASGGVGDSTSPLTSGTAEVATAESDVLTPINPLAAFAVTGASGTGALPAPASVPAPAVAPAAGAETARAEIAPQVAGATESAGSLPRTGTYAAGLVSLALLTLVAGIALRLASRRRVLV